MRQYCLIASLGRSNDAVHIPQVFPWLVVLPQKDLSLNQSAVSIQFLDRIHIISAEGRTNYPLQIAENIPRIRRKRNRYLPSLHRPLDAHNCWMNSEPFRDRTKRRILCG